MPSKLNFYKKLIYTLEDLKKVLSMGNTEVLTINFQQLNTIPHASLPRAILKYPSIPQTALRLTNKDGYKNTCKIFDCTAL